MSKKMQHTDSMPESCRVAGATVLPNEAEANRDAAEPGGTGSSRVPTEELLSAWLNMSLCIRGNRVLSDLTLNEAAICHVLITSESGLSASQLCDFTKLLKSQMNRELNTLEKRGFVAKGADPSDKRRIVVTLTEEGRNCYSDQHARVLRIFEALEGEMGIEAIDQLACHLARATDIADTVIREEF